MEFFDTVEGNPKKLSLREFFELFRDNEKSFNEYLVNDIDKNLSEELKRVFCKEVVTILMLCVRTIAKKNLVDGKESLDRYLDGLKKIRKHATPDIEYIVVLMSFHRSEIIRCINIFEDAA